MSLAKAIEVLTILALVVLVCRAAIAVPAGGGALTPEEYVRGRVAVNVRDFGASGRGEVWTRGQVEPGAREVVVESTETFYPGQGIYLYAETGERLTSRLQSVEEDRLRFREPWPGPAGAVSVYHDDTPAVQNALLRLGSHGEGRLDNFSSRHLALHFPTGQYNFSDTLILAAYSPWMGGEGWDYPSEPSTLAALPGFAPRVEEERFLVEHLHDRIGTGTNSFWMHLRNLRLIGLRPETNPGLSLLLFMGSHPSTVENLSFADFGRSALVLSSQDSVVYTRLTFDASTSRPVGPIVRLANWGPWTPQSMVFEHCRWIGNQDPDLIGLGLDTTTPGLGVSRPESSAWYECTFVNVGRPVVLEGADVSLVRCTFENTVFPSAGRAAVEVLPGSEVFNVEDCRMTGYGVALRTPAGEDIPPGPDGYLNRWYHQTDGERGAGRAEPGPPELPRAPRLLGKAQSLPLNVLDFGASGDAETVTGGTVEEGGRMVVLDSAATFARGQGVLLYHGDEYTVSTIRSLQDRTLELDPPTQLTGRVSVRHDDTAALQRAVDAASTAGAPLLFPQGNYPLSDTLHGGQYNEWIGGGYHTQLRLLVPAPLVETRHVVVFGAPPDGRVQRLTRLVFTAQGMRADRSPQPVSGMLITSNSPFLMTNVFAGNHFTSQDGYVFEGTGMEIRGHSAGLVLRGLFLDNHAGSPALLLEDCRHVFIPEMIVHGAGTPQLELRNCRQIEIGNVDSEADHESLVVHGGSDIRIRSWFNRTAWRPATPAVVMTGSPRNVSLSMMDFAWRAYRGGRPDPAVTLRFTYDGETVLERPHGARGLQESLYWSNVPVDLAVPPQVTELRSEIAANAVRLTWAAVSGAEGYYVYAADRPGDALLYLATVADPTCMIPQVEREMPLAFAVKAFNQAGVGLPSPEVVVPAAAGRPVELPPSAPLFDYPGPPATPAQVEYYPGDGQLTVETPVDRMAPYLIVEQAPAEQGPWAEIFRHPLNVVVVRGLENGRTSFFRTRMANYFGVSEASPPMALTPRAEPVGTVVARLDFDEHNQSYTLDGGTRREFVESTAAEPARRGERFLRLHPGARIRFYVRGLTLDGRYDLRFWVRSSHAGIPVRGGGWEQFVGVTRTATEWEEFVVPGASYVSRGEWLRIYCFSLTPHPDHPVPPDAWLDLDDVILVRAE